MRSLLMVLVFGVLFTTAGFSQDKNEKGCCGSEKSKSTMSKICDVSDEVSLSYNDKDKLVASVDDDKDKKVEKNVKSMDKNTNKVKSKSNFSDDGCCSPDKNKTDKSKAPKS